MDFYLPRIDDGTIFKFMIIKLDDHAFDPIFYNSNFK